MTVEALVLTRDAAHLTKQEREVIRLSAEGKHDGEIASLLQTSTAAVRMAASRALDKTGTSTRAGVVAFALRRGIIR